MCQITRYALTVWTSFLVIVFAGCASTDRKDAVFGNDLPTIQEVYQQSLGNNTANRETRLQDIQDGTADLNGGLLTSYQDLRQQFPLLPNPELMLYIYPHLSAAGLPVPGYYTVFPFYTQGQYALPGETDYPVSHGATH